MLKRVIVLVALLGTNYLTANEEIMITLKDLKGRELQCEIVTKTDSSVTVSNTIGKEFKIPLDKLDSNSRSLIAEWNDPRLELFKLLNSDFITTEVRSGDRNDVNFSNSLRNLAKEYGFYTEFGKNGVPESKLSFVSLIFALQDSTKDKITGHSVHVYFATGGSNYTPGWTLPDRGFNYSKLMRETIMVWPSGLPSYVLNDFRNLQRALFQNQLDMSKRLEKASGTHSAFMSKFYVSQDVRKYSKRLANVLYPYRNMLGLSY